MPYESDKQRRFMHVKHPRIAERWDKEEKGKAEAHFPANDPAVEAYREHRDSKIAPKE